MKTPNKDYRKFTSQIELEKNLREIKQLSVLPSELATIKKQLISSDDPEKDTSDAAIDKTGIYHLASLYEKFQLNFYDCVVHLICEHNRLQKCNALDTFEGRATSRVLVKDCNDTENQEKKDIDIWKNVSSRVFEKADALFCDYFTNKLTCKSKNSDMLKIDNLFISYDTDEFVSVLRSCVTNSLSSDLRHILPDLPKNDESDTEEAEPNTKKELRNNAKLPPLSFYVDVDSENRNAKEYERKQIQKQLKEEMDPVGDRACHTITYGNGFSEEVFYKIFLRLRKKPVAFFLFSRYLCNLYSPAKDTELLLSFANLGRTELLPLIKVLEEEFSSDLSFMYFDDKEFTEFCQRGTKWISSLKTCSNPRAKIERLLSSTKKELVDLLSDYVYFSSKKHDVPHKKAKKLYCMK